MPVDTSPEQGPNTVPDTPQLQQWSIEPASVTINYYQGSATPDPFNAVVVFKDIIGTSQANGYTNFRYRTYIVLSATPEFIVMSGDLVTGAEAYEDYENGLLGDFDFTFQNLATLPTGVYYANVYFEIWANRIILGANRRLEQKSLNFKVNIFPSTAALLSVNEFNFAWTIGSTDPLWAPSFTIDAPIWTLKTPRGFYFQEVFETTITQPTETGGSEISGAGLKTLVMGMMPTAEPDDILQNPITLYMDVNDGVLSVPIHVIFLQESGLFIEKDSLEFVAFKGIQDAEAQTVVLHFDAPYTISCPPWMTVSPATGSGTTTLNFEPISANNMDLGTYTGQAVVTLTSTGAVLGVIDLVYKVLDLIVSPYTPGAMAFTLDRVFMEFLSPEPDAFFSVKLFARLFDFYAQTYRDETLNFKVPLFQGRQTLNIGLPVDRLMARIANLAQHSGFAYNPAQVNLLITQNAGGFTEEYAIGPILFIAGLTPQLLNGNGFLDINPGARRVTPNSWQAVNILNAGGATLSVYKNNTEVTSFSTIRTIFTYRMDFAALGAQQGDVFEFRIVPQGSHASIAKTFKVFPEGYNSNTIVWENEYKLRSVLECTGKYQVNSELENRTQELELQLRPVLEKLESTKTAKLTLNTGWLLRSDMPSVESLMRAPRALLMLQGKNIALVPVSQKITNVDDDRALVSFDLEFQINREYNEEIYSF